MESPATTATCEVFTVWNLASTTVVSTLKHGFSACRAGGGEGPRWMEDGEMAMAAHVFPRIVREKHVSDCRREWSTYMYLHIYIYC